MTTKAEERARIKQAMLASGLTYPDIMTVLDLSDHACSEVQKVVIRISESAPDRLKVQTLISMLLMLRVHVDMMGDTSTKFFEEKYGIKGD
jgi:hypothetical protein